MHNSMHNSGPYDGIMTFSHILYDKGYQWNYAWNYETGVFYDGIMIFFWNYAWNYDLILIMELCNF